MGFDPAQYVQEKSGGADGGFDPAKYVAEKGGADAPSPSEKAMSWADKQMDDSAKKMGYKDARDQSDSIGRSVMGGQIAALAGPAMGALSKFLGRGAQVAAPAVDAAAPAESAAEAAYHARAMAGNALPEAAAESAPSAVDAIKQAALSAAKKYVPAGTLIAGGAAGPEKIISAIKESPKLAAAAGAAALNSTPLGAVAETVVANKMGQEYGAKPSDTAALVSGLKGESKWAMNGFKNVLAHDPSGDLRDDKTIERVFENPKVKQLLIQASDLEPGSKAMGQVVNQIKAELGGKK